MANTLIWIMLYGAVYNVSEWISTVLGVPYIIKIVMVSLYLLIVVIIQRRRGTAVKHKVCLVKNVRTAVILSIPLMVIMLVSLAMPEAYVSFSASSRTIDEVVLIGLLAFSEELLFRGILPVKMIEAFQLREIKCAIVTNVLFALLHTVNFLHSDLATTVVVQVFFAFCLGFCFSSLAERTGSIIPSTIIHFLINVSASSVMEMRCAIIWIIISILCFLYGLMLIHSKNEEIV